MSSDAGCPRAIGRNVVQSLLPTPLFEALQCACAATGQSQSALVREVLTEELRRRNYWPPTTGMSHGA